MGTGDVAGACGGSEWACVWLGGGAKEGGGGAEGWGPLQGAIVSGEEVGGKECSGSW